jgi:hemerythrin-like domain-containing protein
MQGTLRSVICIIAASRARRPSPSSSPYRLAARGWSCVDIARHGNDHGGTTPSTAATVLRNAGADHWLVVRGLSLKEDGDAMTARRLARRHIVLAAGASGTGLLLTSSGLGVQPGPRGWNGEKEVGAVEDLMREHGVLRRALLVFRESGSRLRSDSAAIDPQALHQAALLFRTFGEDYHERKLEEAHIFPAVRHAGGPAASYIDTLVAQHNRGREITDYILAVTGKGTILTRDTENLARGLDALDLMYENHAAREDTIVFPAWNERLSKSQLDELGEMFEDIERQTFGKDGFDDAVATIGRIEQALGFDDIVQFTAPLPPKV